MKRTLAIGLAVLLTTSMVGMAAAAGGTTSTIDAESSTTGTTTEAYAGAHVAFDVEDDAITNYEVGGDEAFSSIAVQSQSEVDATAGVGADVALETMTDLVGAGLALETRTSAGAEVQAESGATLSAHDNERGTLVVESGGESQYVQAELGANADASDEGDRVRVETEDHEGVFLVVGDGEVTVTEEGDVSAALEENATLAYRSYEDGERDEDAKYEESLIAEGSAAAEVYVEERDGETAESAVTYGEGTSAEVSGEARNGVEVTVDRTVDEGTVVLTTVSEEAVGSLEDVAVAVDGEAAVEAESESELESAIEGGDTPRYMVAQEATAQGEATIYVAITHFSERTATISGDGDGEDDAGGDEAADDDTGGNDADDSDTETAEDGGTDGLPGFGGGVAAVALLLAVAARVYE
ncbi:hypothetical protein [Halosolutus halophilus]|uniref:hypothetical protein n=1 Tax=Halosolutus halophilus TaxID=1552990 RepID=UPI0022351F1B|nr:hypothetical protein [Halosolutus halophilus]